MFVLGCICVSIAAIWFGYRLYLAYGSAGGTDFAVPLYDAAMYPPIITTLGLYFVLPRFEIEWSLWVYLGIAVGLAGLAAGAIRIAEELGDKPL